MYGNHLKKHRKMNVKIEIIRVDEENHKATIIALENNLVVLINHSLGNMRQEWDLEDLNQCVKWL